MPYNLGEPYEPYMLSLAAEVLVSICACRGRTTVKIIDDSLKTMLQPQTIHKRQCSILTDDITRAASCFFDGFANEPQGSGKFQRLGGVATL